MKTVVNVRSDKNVVRVLSAFPSPAINNCNCEPGQSSQIDLPTESVDNGYLLAFKSLPPRIVAEGAPARDWLAEAPNNIATVTIYHVIDLVQTEYKQITVTLPPATYSSAMSAALYTAQFSESGVRFVSSGSHVVLELDPLVYPSGDSVTLAISGPGATAMGFANGQTSLPMSGEWIAAADRNLPAITEILTRVEALETSAGSGGAALSSVRRRRSAYWYAAGPPGPTGTFTPVLGAAYASRMPGLGADQLIDAVSVEVTTALGAGVTGVMDFYIAAPHPSYEYPGAIGARLVSYTFTSSDTNRFTIAATTPYSCPEDGDYWLIGVLRSGTSPVLRSHIQNTTVGFGADAPGTPSVGSVGAPGYRDTAFPADASIDPGVTMWTSSVDPGTIVPRYYWRMG